MINKINNQLLQESQSLNHKPDHPPHNYHKMQNK